ncbi:MAG: OmpA family protein [Gammaproteobacteria bacterium]|nr:OmpA family protein [Gammaproteobacteria bacterium]MCF6259861.1 OmpA family protein [Gammaproteobacteria bacterium]
MSVSTPSARARQREQLISNVENAVTHSAQLGDQGLILHFRLVLRDLPFGGQPSLLLDEYLRDEHRQAIEKLVERAKTPGRDIKIFSITGHASEPGSDADNEALSLQRAEAAFEHLSQTVNEAQEFTDNSLYAEIKRRGFGETQPISPMADESDNPLNRRVEIAYRIKIVFPQPPGGVVPRSRYWKIDFTESDSENLVDKEKFAIGVERGQGVLTMLPDDETSQTEVIQKPLNYLSLGVSVGLLSVLKKLKFVTRFPRIKRLLEALDKDRPGNVTRTVDFLEEAGLSVDLVSEGGEFMTQEPLSFAEMANFNFSMVSGNVSLGASGSGSLVMLHSGNFFASTIIYSGELNIAFPDVGLNFIPGALVEVKSH